jgi:hypothetical protein
MLAPCPRLWVRGAMASDRELRIAYQPKITLGSIFIVLGMIVSETVYVVSDHWKATDAAGQNSALSKQRR